MTHNGESEHDKPMRRVAHSAEKPLQSWKEIAAHLERDERTAQRWEKIAGLPVRRHHKGPRSTVYAYPSELDAWRAAHGPKSSQNHLWRWRATAAIGILAVVSGALFIWYGPILNPPNPLVEADGITLRQVWAGPGSDSSGVPSSDGRYLSFVDWETGDLALRDLATEENHRLTNKGTWVESKEFALESIFSRDGKQIAYNWFRDDRFQLRLIGVDGSSPRVLYADDAVAYVRPVDWTPDGSQVLVDLWRVDGPAQIGFVSVPDGSIQVLKSIDRCFPFHMSLSPDGKYIVYDVPLRGEANGGDIFLLSTDTATEAPLIQHPSYDFYPVWTPDGKGVIFASDRTGTLGLWGVQVTDGRPQGQPKLVKADIGRFSPMGFTRAGALYYRVDIGMIDIYQTQLDLKGGKVVEEPTRIGAHFVGSNYCPDLSSDGKYLSYLSKRSPIPNLQVGAQIVIRTLATGEERGIIPKLSSFILPDWSPDGRYFVTSGRDWKGQGGVFKIDANTGETTTIFEHEPDTAVGNPVTWSRDGKSILYSKHHFSEKRRTLELRNLKTGQVKELFRAVEPNQIRKLNLSRDGRFLAFLIRNWKTDVEAIHVVPVAGGKSRQLLQVRKPEYLVASFEWTLDDEEILFAKGRETEAEDIFELMRISSEGGEPRRLGLAQNQRIRDLRLYPDGNTLVFTMGQTREFEVWAMEGFLPEQ